MSVMDGPASSKIGNRVFLFLHTDDFWRDYEAMKTKGIAFTGTPRNEAYGTVAVFIDLYGSKWDLIEPSTAVCCPKQLITVQVRFFRNSRHPNDAKFNVV
jgi:hypothetical protein